MIYKILNNFIDKKIDSLRPIVKNFLKNDLKEQEDVRRKIINKDVVSALVHSEKTDKLDENISTISKRLKMEEKYIILIDRFKNDLKRQYMIRKNYYAYLKAIKYLYDTSGDSFKNGNLTAPASIYHIIGGAEECFNQLNAKHL